MATACAESNPEAKVKQLVESSLGKDAKVDSVIKTPYMGLYEVRSGTNILYTDQEAKYLFVGNILDAKTHQNFTKERLDDLNKVAFSDLPLDLALKKVKGDGSRVIAVFSDPNCGYCKRFEKALQDVDNITVYTFMYNVLSKDSDTKARNVWCSSDRNQAWGEWMLEGKAPAAASANCTTPNEKVFELGRKLRITGTPTIIFKDGSRVPGAMDAKALEEKLATVK
jgi:thiol:disulfide interchange protein DsbC